MNDSARWVQAAARFFKVEPDAILVVHDESDLEPGRLQARLGGGFAGHNGLRSVARHLGTPDFLRLRVGVGRPGRGDRRPLADYVLSDFEPHEDREGLVARAAEAVETLDTEGLAGAGPRVPPACPSRHWLCARRRVQLRQGPPVVLASGEVNTGVPAAPLAFGGPGQSQTGRGSTDARRSAR